MPLSATVTMSHRPFDIRADLYDPAAQATKRTKPAAGSLAIAYCLPGQSRCYLNDAAGRSFLIRLMMSC